MLYSVDKPTNEIAIIELSRAKGRFTAVLPYGLKDKSSKEDVRRVYKRLGFPLHDENGGNSLWSRGDIKIHGAASSLIYFDFSRAGQLVKAGLNGDLTTE